MSYLLRVAFDDAAEAVAECRDSLELLDRVGLLSVGLYQVYAVDSGAEVGALAVHPSGAWSLNLRDGRAFEGRSLRASLS